MITNRKTRRRHKKQNLNQYSEYLTEISEDNYFAKTGKKFDENLKKCFVSKYFFVQIWEEPEKPVRISICRTELNGKGQWQDNIGWDAIQSIKNSVGYSGMDCVEIYPMQRDVINVANMRHLWVIPGQVEYKWRKA